MKKQIGMIGLGKMGGGLALQLLEKGWDIIGFLRSEEKGKAFAEKGMKPVYSLKEIIPNLEGPRVLWTMLPAGNSFDEIYFGENGLIHDLSAGDIVVDAANSFYKDAIERGEQFAKKGIKFIDIGVSGGPAGARNGACMMVGGEKDVYECLLPMLQDMSCPGGVSHFEGLGAGHFVKMVHNGIEYGMMQAIGEGYEVMKKSSFNLDLSEVTRIYNTGSVIESRLIGWLQKAYVSHGQELTGISGTVKHSGEGEWTVKTAEEMGVSVPVIKESFDFRVQSEGNPSYTGKVVSALRNQFGGHEVKEE